MSYSSSSTIQLPHPSFESRMRDAVQMPRRVVPAVQKVPGRPAHVQEIITLEDYQRVVAEEKEKMVVVRFHAPWCRVSVHALQLDVQHCMT
jgi:hypothetical protein